MNYVLKIGKTAQIEIDDTFKHYSNIQLKLGLRFIETLEAILDRKPIDLISAEADLSLVQNKIFQQHPKLYFV